MHSSGAGACSFCSPGPLELRGGRHAIDRIVFTALLAFAAIPAWSVGCDESSPVGEPFSFEDRLRSYRCVQALRLSAMQWRGRGVLAAETGAVHLLFANASFPLCDVSVTVDDRPADRDAAPT
jgi:hypothetical protein